MQSYEEAIRRMVCLHCIDSLPSGRCALMRYTDCPVPKFLPHMVNICHSLRSDYAEDYRSIVRKQICPICPNSFEGDCPLRAVAGCPLDRYLVLVLEAIDRAEEGLMV